MEIQLHRPKGYIGENDNRLNNIFRELKHLFQESQKYLIYSTLRLPPKKAKIFSAALVEFAEDLHNDIGIWNSYEQYNVEFFNNSLPMTPYSEYKDDKNPISRRRIHHFIWMLYSLLNHDLILSPTHKDLFLLTPIITEFLQKEFNRLSKMSSIKDFLSETDEFGWVVKKKLLWLGRHSYFFRFCFHNYVKEHGKEDISTIDDFVCQETTVWSGLVIIDILAAILNISKEQQTELRNWHERHCAYYRIIDLDGEVIHTLNLINDKPYNIRVGEFTSQFKMQQVIFGSLVPWKDEWYWSGMQHNCGNLSDTDVLKLKNVFLKNASKIAYRYCDDLAKKARESMTIHYRSFLNYHKGKDLVIYPDGLSMAADEEKFYHAFFDSKPKELVSDIIKKHGLKGTKPRMSFPSHVLDCEKGVALFFNKEEGREIFINFDLLKSGLKKKGINLNEEEQVAIREFIFSDSISPNFIDKMIQKYGSESFKESFLIRDHDRLNINYLMRKYKGHYYRKRYPNLSFVFEI